MKKNIFLSLVVMCFTASSQAGWLVKQSHQGSQVTVHSVTSHPRNPKQKIVLKHLPEFLAETEKSSASFYEEVLYPQDQLPQNLKSQAFKKIKMTSQEWPGAEVRTLVQQGPLDNRIDLTIVGDGYTLAEREKFFADAERITHDLFVGKTFASYLALFNVHAVFVPSKESGLTDVEARDTALGLYRNPPNSKRAIMPGNTAAIERAIELAPQTDYPVLVANDDFYGGLGGRYAITTRSEVSGSMVLRHELGHNFGNVGEEYDGGSVYQGANSASSASHIPWRHWLEDELKVFEIQFLSGDYVWQPLLSHPYKTSFRMPAGGYVFDTRISSVGWSSPDDVRILVDDQVTEIEGVYTADRSFFNFKNMPALSAGSHSIEVRDHNGDGDNFLAFAQLFANPANIIKDRNYVGAYATFNAWGSKAGYRPTFNTCLMYDMLSKDFCAVDKENMWIRFMSQTELIDLVEKKDMGDRYQVSVQTPALTGLSIHWAKIDSGSETVIAKGVSSVSFEKNARGTYRVYVEFETPEVRKPNVRFISTKEFQLE